MKSVCYLVSAIFTKICYGEIMKKTKSKGSGVKYYWIIGLILLFQVFKYVNANKDYWFKKDPEFLSEQKKMEKFLKENPGILELIEKESENIIQMNDEEKKKLLETNK
jgi:hypothetical protein